MSSDLTEDERRSAVQALNDFLRAESAGGIVLLIATIAALVAANGPTADWYEEFVHQEINLGFETESLQHWVNGGLMTIFFFLVGLEIKRELVLGELRDPRAASLPAIGALGGMVLPALTYFLFNYGDGAAVDGWAIPVATDIAFVVGILALFGNRLPAGLKLFLLTLAIVDDIGGILVIAVFYTENLSLLWLVLAAVGVIGIVVQKRVGVVSPWWYLPWGFAVWLALLEAGVESAIAGVIVGMLTPAHTFKGRNIIHELEHALSPVSAFIIVPIFAFVNAGVPLSTDTVSAALGSMIFWGIVAGLVVGKTVGVSVFTAVGERLKIGRLPRGTSMRSLIASSPLTGIGFTVALFIAALAFEDPETEDILDIAKIGILFGSLAAGILGTLAILAFGQQRNGQEDGAREGPDESGDVPEAITAGEDLA